MLQSAVKFLHNSFVKPVSNVGLLGLYVSSVLCLAGHALMAIYVAFDLAGLGFLPLLIFFTLHPIIANIFVMPCGFYALNRFNPKVVMSLGFAAQLAVLGLLLCGLGLSPVLLMLLASLVSLPYWLLFHTAMLNYSSNENIGNEVSLAHVGMAVGKIIGAVAAGLLLESAVSRGVVLLIGTGTLILATALLFFLSLKLNILKASKAPRVAPMRYIIGRIIKSNPERSKATSLDMIYETAVGSLWPVWLKLIGAGGMAVGLLMSINVAVKFLLSPLVGRYVNLKNGVEIQTGPALKLIGWAPWLFFVHPMVSLWSSTFFVIGSHLFRVGLEARWYESRSYTHLMVREICLGFGRIAAALIFIPILFYAMEYFVPLGIAFTVLILISGTKLRKESFAAVLQPIKASK